MTIGSTEKLLSFRFNNYRRELRLRCRNYAIKGLLGGTIDLTNKLHISEHTGIITIREYAPQVMIQMGKQTITAIWSQRIINGNKETFVIEGNPEGISEWLDNKTEEIKTQLDSALLGFVRRYNLKLVSYKPVWKRKELEIKGDTFIDSLPAECLIHDTVGKKVYETGFEFKDEVYVKNYIKNRAVEELGPEIRKDLKEIKEMIQPKKTALQECLDVINKETNDIDSMIQGLRSKIKGLSSDMEREHIENMIYLKYGD